MDGRIPDEVDEFQLADTPEDVAVLYSWANLKGAKYRDFSASRRQYRALLRHQKAEEKREVELRAKAQAEAAAADTEEAAREAEDAARFHESEAIRAAEERRRQESDMQQVARDRAMRHAADLTRRAASERMEASRRAEAVAAAEAASRREAREVADAKASAQRQAARYAESEQMRRDLAGPQPEPYLPGEISDPYTDEQPPELPGRMFHRPIVSDEDLRPTRLPRSRDPLPILPGSAQQDSAENYQTRAAQDSLYWAREDSYFRGEVQPASVEPLEGEDGARTPASYSYEPNSQERVAAVDQYAQYAPYVEPVPSDSPEPRPAERFGRFGEVAETAPRSEDVLRRPRGFQPDEASGVFPASGQSNASTPAWLYTQDESSRVPEPRRREPPPMALSAPPDTLQESRERVASRWYGLKGVLRGDAPEIEAESYPAVYDTGAAMPPMLTVFSLAGGVGKTSLVATLGRALSSGGESVLLADTTSHGLLPFYFGASELKPGMVRRFSPPPGGHDAPIALVSYETMGKDKDPLAGEWLGDELSRASSGMQRVLLDLAPNSSWVVRRLARLNSVMIVPVAPDMNSVISLGPVEKFFAGMIDGDGRPVQPFYLLNGFDPSLPLHLDVREVMRQQLADRLLPFVIRRSPSVSEALAEGMTVMDYAPDAPVASDYLNLASWLRAQSAPASPGSRNTRWSER